MRAGHRANDVEGVVDVGDPVAHGFVERVLQRLAAAFNRHHGGAQQVHAIDIGALALDVFAAHIDHAFQAIARANRGGGHAVLAGAGFGNHARFAHAFGQHGLAYGVVDLVRAGVVEVFALEVNLRAALLAAHARGMVNGGRAAYKMLEFGMEFGEKFRVMLVFGVSVLELIDRMGQGLRDETAAVNSEMACRIRLLVVEHGWRDSLQVVRRQRGRLRQIG